MSDLVPLAVPATPANAKCKNVELTEEQGKKREEVLSHFDKNDYRIPGLSAEEKAELMEEEKMWLSNDCMLRYLRASKWHVHQAITRLEDTLKWRREYGFYTGKLTSEYVEPEAVTGKEIIFGFDRERRPGLYMFPSRQNTSESPRQIEYAVWMLERCIDLMGPGVETLDLLINFADRAKNPSISTSRQVLHILQAHYPERLGLALIINVPFLVNAFFKVIMPFVDPITRNKVKFNPGIFEDGFYDKDQVMHEAGWDGGRQFEWNHEKYWPALVGMCEERRAKTLKRWRELGAKVGLSEWEMKTSWEESPPQQSSEHPQEKYSEVQPTQITEVPAVAETTA